jgi:hypothetical protein
MTPTTEYREIPLTQGQVSLVDSADYEWLSQWRWTARWDKYTKSFYAGRNFDDTSGKRNTILMHRQILGLMAGDKRKGDHENRNTLDNRRGNLRIATTGQNAANRITRDSNRSGFKGVYRPKGRKGNKPWMARAGVNGREVFLGYYATPEEAHAAYCAAAAEIHGEFARFK